MFKLIKRCLHGASPLPSRKFLNISGNDAGKFLQNLTTNDIFKLTGNSGQYSALLNAQGRLMYDVFVYRVGEEYYVECDGQIQERVFFHLQTYNLRTRTKIQMIENSENVPNVVFSSIPLDGAVAIVKDTRSNWNFSRYLFGNKDEMKISLQTAQLSIFTEGRYNRERILRGIPEGAYEISSRQSIPLEYNIDLMGGIDFNKGCYIGQELVTRTHHRGVVRKRILPLKFYALDPDTCKPIRPEFQFQKDSPLTINLDKQNEFLPTSLDSEGKLRILSRTDSVGKVVMAEGNIGLGMMRLESLKLEENRKNLATLDHNENNWILADAIIPEWWPKTIFE